MNSVCCGERSTGSSQTWPLQRRSDMRDIFDDIYKHNPLDPEESVRRGTRVDLRKRFYEKASIDQNEGAYRGLARRQAGEDAGAPRSRSAIVAHWRRRSRKNGMRRRT